MYMIRTEHKVLHRDIYLYFQVNLDFFSCIKEGSQQEVHKRSN